MSLQKGSLVVRTSWNYASPAGSIWPLLCNSKMDGSGAFLFRFGLPRPLQCRLPGGNGGTGSERECISDRGTIHQKILVWEPERKLSFRMERSDYSIFSGISGIKDTFDMAPIAGGVKVSRKTEVTLEGRLLILKKIALFFGLRQIHSYVFRNWEKGSQQPLLPKSR